jgi:TorA maturation chaperone TorD
VNDEVSTTQSNTAESRRPEASTVPSEDELRSGAYGLLATLLRDVPEAPTLERLRDLQSGNSRDDFEVALAMLRLAAQQVNPDAVDDEFHQLFIGIGRGEVVPFASWYMTGFLMEKPLGILRQDLAVLGFERQEGVREPEDHIAALCEVMAMLASGDDAPFEVQKRFYERHLAPWVQRFFADLEAADSAVFYKAVGRLGDEFFKLEQRYFEMEV